LSRKEHEILRASGDQHLPNNRETEMSWVEVNDFQHPTGWLNASQSEERARWYCQQLEEGQILFFRHIPFELSQGHREFLLSQRQVVSRSRKIVYRSRYDHFMLRFHDYLKESTAFQSESSKIRCEFPPQTTWIVFTDAVPHAALSGQFALEHTYIVPLQALLSPEKAPVRLLERLCGRTLSM